MAWGNSLFEMTTDEAKQKLTQTRMAVIPTGSIEQHGPHLPLGTDAMAGIVFGRRVAEKLNALFVPFSVIGVTPYHMSWPGTLTLRQSTYINMFIDVCESLYRHGIREVLVTNGHEGNIPPLRVAADEVQQKLDGMRIVFANTWVVVNKLFPDLEQTHAAAMETMEVLCYDPSLVHLERATDPSELEAGRTGHQWSRGNDIFVMMKDFKEVALTGWYGSLEGATVDRVPEVLEKVSDYIATQAMAMFKNLREVENAGR